VWIYLLWGDGETAEERIRRRGKPRQRTILTWCVRVYCFILGGGEKKRTDWVLFIGLAGWSGIFDYSINNE